MRRKTEQTDIDPLRPAGLAVRFPVRSDYDPVRPSLHSATADIAVPTPKAIVKPQPDHAGSRGSLDSKVRGVNPSTELGEEAPPVTAGEKWRLKHGHGLSYAGLFLFTVLLYARPAEFYPHPLTASITLIVGLATLAFFIPSQLSLEGTLTARPAEVSLVLLFCLTALLSIPLAINPPTAWHEFSGTFIRCIVMFIVIVNVVRTKARLKGLLFLALVSAIWLSVEAINDVRLGLATVDGYRTSGRGSGIFGNTNDMALHVVTLLPICVALLFGARGLGRKLLFGVGGAVMVAAIILSYSRGAFLGLIAMLVFMAMKLGPRHRVGTVLVTVVLGIAVLLFAPDNYGGRLLSIFMPSLDPGGSADARRGELFRSIYIAIRHPLLGIGMGNYQNEMSYRGQVTHNAYTQVAAELGMAALVCYTMFIVTPFRKLGQIGRETFVTRRDSQYYYLAVGLQGALLAYMVSSFFLSVSYLWYVYYLVGFAVCLRRLYEAETGKAVVVATRKERKSERERGRKQIKHASLVDEARAVST